MANTVLLRYGQHGITEVWPTQYYWGMTNTMGEATWYDQHDGWDNMVWPTRWVRQHTMGEATCIMSYLQGQDLWEIVGRCETTPPKEDFKGALRKWRIKADKAMFVLKTTIREEMLEHIVMTRHQKKHGTRSWCCSQRRTIRGYNFWRMSCCQFHNMTWRLLVLPQGQVDLSGDY